MSLICGEVWPTNPRYTRCYNWAINDFTLNSVKNELQSPIFSMTCLKQKYSWQLCLYPNGKRVEDRDYLSVFLYNRSSVIFTGSIRFSILNNKSEVITSSEIDGQEIAKNKDCGLHQFVKSSTIRTDVLANSATLVIVCEIRYNDEEARRKISQSKIKALRLQDFDLQEKLVQDGKFSDVTFIVDDLRDEPLELHKCILANSSSVFAAMFESNPEQRTIEITDMEYCIFIEVIWFAYIGRVQDIDEMEGDVLAAAVKYKMDGLKLFCEISLCDKLSVDNVFENLRLAEVYGAEKLKAKAIEFIVSNGKEIVQKPEFQSLPADVLCRICSDLIINQNND